MARRTETAWKALLARELRKLGARVLSLHGHAMQAPGWPDLYVCHARWSGWLELKRGRGELSEAQRVEGRWLEAWSRFHVLRCDDAVETFAIENASGDAVSGRLRHDDASGLMEALNDLIR